MEGAEDGPRKEEGGKEEGKGVAREGREEGGYKDGVNICLCSNQNFHTCFNFE